MNKCIKLILPILFLGLMGCSRFEPKPHEALYSFGDCVTFVDTYYGKNCIKEGIVHYYSEITNRYEVKHIVCNYGEFTKTITLLLPAKQVTGLCTK